MLGYLGQHRWLGGLLRIGMLRGTDSGVYAALIGRRHVLGLELHVAHGRTEHFEKVVLGAKAALNQPLTLLILLVRLLKLSELLVVRAFSLNRHNF